MKVLEGYIDRSWQNRDLGGIKSSKTKAKYKEDGCSNRQRKIVYRLLLDSYFEQKSEIEKELDFWLNGFEHLIYFGEFMSTKLVKKSKITVSLKLS